MFTVGCLESMLIVSPAFNLSLFSHLVASGTAAGEDARTPEEEKGAEDEEEETTQADAESDVPAVQSMASSEATPAGGVDPPPSAPVIALSRSSEEVAENGKITGMFLISKLVNLYDLA